MMRMSCRSYLKRHKRRTLYHIQDILLTKCGGGFQPIGMLPGPTDRVERLMARIHTGVMISGFSRTDALSVDAIVAWV